MDGVGRQAHALRSLSARTRDPDGTRARWHTAVSGNPRERKVPGEHQGTVGHGNPVLMQGRLDHAHKRPPRWRRRPVHQDLQPQTGVGDRKSTRLNSSHGSISYAVFCLKKKTKFITCPYSYNKIKSRYKSFERKCTF